MLTPRARRREALRDKAQRRKRENEERMAAARAKRRAMGENKPAAGNAAAASRAAAAKPPPAGPAAAARQRRAARQPPRAGQAARAKAPCTSCEANSAAAEAAQRERDAAASLAAEHEQRAQELAGRAELAEAALAAREAELVAAQDVIRRLQADLEEKEKAVRDLRNTVLELKGNIRVFARVRPAAPAEANVFSFPEEDPERQHITVRGEARTAPDGSARGAQTWGFKFDKVFRASQGQEEVFEEVQHMIQSTLDGYRVCIFAYGQTGSGKTYTMDGEGVSGAERGIIPRAMEMLFAGVQADERHEYEMRVSFLEIYNEQIRDLAASAAGAATPDKEATFDIRHNPRTGETTVQGLTSAKVESPEEFFKLLETAREARSVGATGSNERSSRSHSVFTLTVLATHRATGETRRGVLNLVDLAGSERLAQSKVQGKQLKETQAINKSLSSLGDVIFALASGSRHVPYRNSKLTYLLQNSLGGNCKTLMLVNLSPANAQESLCSLRFGHKVNSCDIGTAKVVKARQQPQPQQQQQQ